MFLSPGGSRRTLLGGTSTFFTRLPVFTEKFFLRFPTGVVSGDFVGEERKGLFDLRRTPHPVGLNHRKEDSKGVDSVDVSRSDVRPLRPHYTGGRCQGCGERLPTGEVEYGTVL